MSANPFYGRFLRIEIVRPNSMNLNSTHVKAGLCLKFSRKLLSPPGAGLTQPCLPPSQGSGRVSPSPPFPRVWRLRIQISAGGAGAVPCLMWARVS